MFTFLFFLKYITSIINQNPKIYNIIATIIILLLVILVAELRNELTQTKEVLEQCADRYYEEIGK
ncbi:hypothetical protein [Chryseobacterium salivictor]|uniref:hypothetical protein n=1 Tax=Chryseobacterium salivictor TaxID=2547600 RepID=UPI00105FEDF1|nr:hypothetical protein [Chryseobacterium salivictor]